MSSRRLPRWLARTLVSLGVLAAVLVGGYRVFLRLTRIDPPPGAGAGVPRPALTTVSAPSGPRAFVGASWVGRDRGIWEYHLEGAPFSLGYSHARLGTALLLQTEEYLFGEMRRYVPSRAALQLIRLGVMLKFRHLLDPVSSEQRLELAGLAAGQADMAEYGDFLPIYHRVVFYHALHDITQTLEHSPLLGCTAVAAAGAATPSGHLVLGRNFDFEGPPLFDQDKAVQFFRPQGKLAFASVSWTGMMGVVTGLNVAGIYVSVNALRTDDKSQSGVPVELLLREVLESAHTLDEALTLLKSRPVLVPDLYLVGDGNTGEAAVLERSPTRAEVRRSRDVLAVANHALSPAFSTDKENARLRNYLTSGARMARAEELLAKHRGQLDPARVLSILRDKSGPGDAPLGLGNRSALDAIIATHSVVVDATDRILWIGVGPHALGRYVGFDLRRELLGEDRPQPADLPEDPTQYGEDFRAFRIAQQALAASERLKSARPPDLMRAIEQASRAVALQPRMPEARKALGDLLRQRGTPEDIAAARIHYSAFLGLHPPYLREIEEVQRMLGNP